MMTNKRTLPPKQVSKAPHPGKEGKREEAVQIASEDPTEEVRD